ncbi:hypothetical protein LSTR_LSTR009703 [Laodelphax striatellus]|uniref:Uncharacterized protein n=1 Tax=Laodelphax striatellus TaxID=195883 RepID=A0A482WUN3_LAOST|nr:hypothetical protein LSTR_LSTR009703 [Laodelphax striatellus]
MERRMAEDECVGKQMRWRWVVHTTPYHSVVLWFIRLVGRDGHGCGTCPGSLGTDDVRCDCDTMGTVTESSTPESMTECDCARGRSNPAQVH